MLGREPGSFTISSTIKAALFGSTLCAKVVRNANFSHLQFDLLLYGFLPDFPFLLCSFRLSLEVSLLHSIVLFSIFTFEYLPTSMPRRPSDTRKRTRSALKIATAICTPLPNSCLISFLPAGYDLL